MSDHDELDPRHEDALRSAFRSGVPHVDTDHDAWSTLEWKAAGARRRDRRRRLALTATSIAAASLLLVVGVAVLWNDPEPEPDGLVAGPGPTTSTPVDTGGPGVDPAPAEVGPGIWPFHSDVDADASHDDRFLDPREAVRSFLVDFAGVTPTRIGDYFAGDSRSGEVPVVTAGGRHTGLVLVRQLGEAGRFTVVGAVEDRLTIDRPGGLDVVSSPVSVSGRSAGAFEGTVVIDLFLDGDEPDDPSGREPAIGGQADLQPYEAEVELAEPSSATGATVLVRTFSAEDGSAERVAAVRVVVDPDGGPATSVDGGPLPEGHVLASIEPGIVEIDVEGTVTRTVVDAFGDGATTLTDIDLAADRAFFAYAEARESLCDSTVHVTPLADGVAMGDGLLTSLSIGGARHPAISPDGRRLAWVADDDCDGQHELVVAELAGFARSTDGEAQRYPDASPGRSDTGETPVRLGRLQWSPDGQSIAMVVHLEDGSVVSIRDLDDTTTASGAGTRLPIDDGFMPFDLAWRTDGFMVVALREGWDGDQFTVLLDPATGDGGDSRTTLGPLRSLTVGPDHALLWIDPDGGLWRHVDGEPRTLSRTALSADG